MRAQITIHLVPDDSLTEGELDELYRRAERGGQTPDEFVTDAIKTALTPRPSEPVDHPEPQPA